jgi:FkbM family methyltransferase
MNYSALVSRKLRLSRKNFVRMISRIVNRILSYFNLEMRFKTKDFLEILLASDEILELYDVGANRGQYAQKSRALGYRGKIYSFEPLLEENQHLQLLAQKDPDWIAVAPVALGSQRGTGSINRSGNSVSSSFLQMNESHLDLDSNSKFIGVQETPIETLDFYFQMYHQEGNTCFLKLDVQGFESQILDGCSEALSKIKYLQIELSLSNLYSGSKLFNPMHEYLLHKGYELVDIILGVRNPKTKALAQFDGIYRRIDHAES